MGVWNPKLPVIMNLMNTFIRQKAETDRQADRQTNKQWQHNHTIVKEMTIKMNKILLCSYIIINNKHIIIVFDIYLDQLIGDLNPRNFRTFTAANTEQMLMLKQV